MAEMDPEDVVAILFTFGWTGQVKGVVYKHRHFVNQFE
jgi:long-subunit acyl-CoA synthetase (AMP-forming)